MEENNIEIEKYSENEIKVVKTRLLEETYTMEFINSKINELTNVIVRTTEEKSYWEGLKQQGEDLGVKTRDEVINI